MKKFNIYRLEHEKGLSFMESIGLPDDKGPSYWSKLKRWSKAVRKRDGKCMQCGSTMALQAHHNALVVTPWRIQK